MKLWKKDYELNKKIESFTVGNDHILDQKLIKHDCMASIAHAKMLCKIGILDQDEMLKLVETLEGIIALDEKDEFIIKKEDEDCHTAIENYLVLKCGDAGKKIHTGRSRNDQVLTALRLYEKEEIGDIKALLCSLKDELLSIIDKKGGVKMPGYTHMQKAMPIEISVWLGSFISSIDEDIKLLDACYVTIDQSPLGSAAGFGVPLIAIDKGFTSKEMGFSKVMDNPLYCQMSRGKIESSMMHALSQVMFTLNKLSTDLIMFSMEEFGFIYLPDEFCTGSSIMPQKKNPDVLELVRAKYYVVMGEEFKVKDMMGNLMSGYNRDLQLTKEPLFNSIDTTKGCIEIMTILLQGISIDQEKCESAITEDMFATEKANALVLKGMPFREAYAKVSKDIGG